MKVREVIEKIKQILKRDLPEGYRIYLFGSWARGNAEERSDIDIAILGDQELDWMTFLKIKEKIEDIPTLRKIDVVDLRAVGRQFREEVLRHGIELK
jgi:predicted nucleotidyltransferase